MLKVGDKIGILCCSNGQKKSYKEKIGRLEDTLRTIGLEPIFCDYIYEKENIFGGTAEERANALMQFYKDEKIKGIFDISGGDIANGILPYLDYEVIKNSSKIFWGYSDLTTVINAVYKKTGKASVLYQIRNLIYDSKEQQTADFKDTVINKGNNLFRLNYKFIQGNEMHGVVIGGNIRCLLKLAGTEYMPDFADKLLLLESLSGTVAKMETYLCQLKQLGAFDKIAGIILGTFTEMENEKCTPTIETLVKKIVAKDLPIVVTPNIGHGTNSKAIVIGGELSVKN